MSVAVAVDVSGVGNKAQAPSDAVYLAALMLCSRLYHRGESPLGIQGGFDLGALYVRTRDPDISALLRGKRGIALSTDQAWPDVAAVRARARIGSDVADAQIAEVVAAVREHLALAVASFGIA